MSLKPWSRVTSYIGINDAYLFGVPDPIQSEGANIKVGYNNPKPKKWSVRNGREKNYPPIPV